LIKAIPFRSCVGIPLKTPAHDAPWALFFFSSQAHQFTSDSESLLEEKRSELENLIYRFDLFSSLLNAQREILLSRLRAGALHDVNNSIGSMSFYLESLSARSNELLDGIASKETVVSLAALTAEIKSLASQMNNTLVLFRELGANNKWIPENVNSIVRRSIESQRPLAVHLGTTLSFSPDHTIPDSLINPSYLLQIVDNVLLNALQWVADRRVRFVEVSTVYQPADPERPIKIRVEDTGPGIHEVLQKDRIFELGYTTRSEGSGLGLFIARALGTALDAKITVEKSFIEFGTVFIIELPLSKP
jgi:signal transduction histidine kinase